MVTATAQQEGRLAREGRVGAAGTGPGCAHLRLLPSPDAQVPGQPAGKSAHLVSSPSESESVDMDSLVRFLILKMACWLSGGQGTREPMGRAGMLRLSPEFKLGRGACP